MLVTFADRLDDAANRAALTFRAAIDAQGWEGVEETASSLASAYVAFDPVALAPDMLAERLRELLGQVDLVDPPLPAGRRLWTVPVCFEGEHAPQLDDAAAAAGLSRRRAIDELCARPLRALALGFAPGQAYLGQLPEHWNIPRQSDLTPRVPQGAVVVAVRQAIIFATSAPTGWRQVGHTRFAPFRPDDPAAPIPFTPGDEIRFAPVSVDEYDRLAGPDGGATCEVLE
ncbi:carboxyltransferase domain-containing protein [Palleronia sediminis]|uniref:Carboxyltransferase domain-containing protein n=2 Tax=Palleronia sediminis TaxID=2547833 RepID=A0A4V3BA91_9RHOB|nr:carboxyltransferase domain-containing protein [Palleronia sediminis]